MYYIVLFTINKYNIIVLYTNFTVIVFMSRVKEREGWEGRQENWGRDMVQREGGQVKVSGIKIFVELELAVTVIHNSLI